MKKHMCQKSCGFGLLLTATVLMYCPSRSCAQAQNRIDSNPLPKLMEDNPRIDEYSGGHAISQNINTEPYNGQIYCPVTGMKLGLNQPPVPVQTSIGEEKPSSFARLLGKKDKPGLVIFVCSEKYVDQVRRDPQTYLAQVIRDKSYFSFRYAEAPRQRPADPSIIPGAPPRDLAGEVASTQPAVPPSGGAPVGVSHP
jgi:hypothetical protein